MSFRNKIGPLQRLVFAPLLLVIFSTCPNVRGQNEALNLAETAPEAASLLAPMLGRPVFAAPGGAFQIVARIPEISTSVSLELISPTNPEFHYPIEVNEKMVSRLTAGLPILATVPANAAPRTYDLLISSGAVRLRGRHCVAVGRYDRDLRIVHLSNMNIGDVGAPMFDERLIEEINLIDPALIVATGDYLDATHPDIESGWEALVEFLCRFDAPVVMAYGDHDDIDLYCRHAAPSPVGLINVGRHRCLILYDLPRSSIADNPEQIRWIERMLGQPGFTGLTFVATHDDSPNLLGYWQSQGTLDEMLKSGRIGLWFVAGHVDWAGRDYGELIESADPMVYVRTHQSSSAPRGGASGVSHYRVVDIAGDRVSFPQLWRDKTACPPSVPVGLLQATLDGPNDGSRSRLSLTATNNHPYRLEKLEKTVRLRKNLDHQPWCRGAELTSIIDLDAYWECRVRFDLPDKGVLTAELGSGAPQALRTVSVDFDVADQMPFRLTNSSQGVTYYSCQGTAPIVRIHNNGDKAATVSPLIRFDGDLLAYQPLSQRAGFATAYRLLVAPGETIGLRVDLSAVRVALGRRDLQVYLNSASADSVYSRSIEAVEAK